MTLVCLLLGIELTIYGTAVFRQDRLWGVLAIAAGCYFHVAAIGFAV